MWLCVCFHNVSCNSIDWLMWVSVTRALTACCLIFDLCSDALQELLCAAGVNLWMILSALHLNNKVFATSRKQILKENWTDKVFSSEFDLRTDVSALTGQTEFTSNSSNLSDWCCDWVSLSHNPLRGQILKSFFRAFLLHLLQLLLLVSSRTFHPPRFIIIINKHSYNEQDNIPFKEDKLSLCDLTG